MSSFKDELIQNTKTPKQLADEEKENIICTATYDYNNIKSKLLSSARNGCYLDLGDKKLISIQFESSYLSKSISRIDRSTSTPKIFGRGNHVFGHVEYFIKNQNYFDLYITTLQNLGIDDDIAIHPVFVSDTLGHHSTVTLPYVYTGTYHLMHKIKSYLQCSITY